MNSTKWSRLLLAATGTVVIAGSALAATASPAMASSHKPCTNTFECFNGFSFGGGTLSIDIDAIGGPQRNLQWQVDGVCSATYTTNDPPRSWVCRNVPAGNYTLRTSDDFRHNWSIGTRP
ncbi:hypothetical protein [Fodinicola feengrottensis]|uniref:Uncharacterized protein n=1 Tax=Fodinicola feengrottensis TaxID=435914 RepID=A0ABP4V2Z6_9ACTN|nr:hypothetical protein [Fodinicola feengrottensis]